MPYQLTFVQLGNTVDLPVTSPVVQGQVVQAGRLAGVIVREVTQAEIDAGHGVAALRVDGVWKAPKGGVAITGGASLWWDPAGEVVATAGGAGLVPLGFAVPAGAAAGDVTVDVLLVPGASLS